MCVCVCVCARACAGARVHACAGMVSDEYNIFVVEISCIQFSVEFAKCGVLTHTTGMTTIIITTATL